MPESGPIRAARSTPRRSRSPLLPRRGADRSFRSARCLRTSGRRSARRARPGPIRAEPPGVPAFLQRTDEALDLVAAAPASARTGPRATRGGPHLRRAHDGSVIALSSPFAGFFNVARMRSPIAADPSWTSTSTPLCEMLRVRPRIAPVALEVRVHTHRLARRERRLSSLVGAGGGAADASAVQRPEPAADPGGRLAELHRDAGPAAYSRHLRGHDVHDLALEIDHPVAQGQPQPHDTNSRGAKVRSVASNTPPLERFAR